MGEPKILNNRGEWVPAIPLPFFGLRKRCDCGQRFWTMSGYEGHYALRHILSLTGSATRSSRPRSFPLYSGPDEVPGEVSGG